MQQITLTPAYGRDYKSLKALEQDLRAGKDFIYHKFMDRYDGKPCTISDLTPGTKVKVRYLNNTRVNFITI